ncbi:SDR family oxidoreductase [Nocardioides sp. zg-DK7169]|uniref:SDR family oxidoreductase n=1 Tax=Nocardioides sp. zg-DK7169 TaxID=2736600 RepID=UPI001555EAC4|nr:SDR family oxidoreductase [Nocardioides sp. zg-DK7169]NPC95311.1 SDR family oxidoreductase [Nocardioides sp. zg-DK7169]
MSSIVVTGSTKGVGNALAREFLRRGHSVVVTGRGAAAVEEAVGKLTPDAAGGARVVGRATDVTDPDEVQALWDHAVAELGRVDVWVNNAGVANTTAAIVDTAASDVRAMVSTNMLGTIFGSQVAVRGMTAQGGGQLFNVLGGGSDGKIRPNMGVYAATKRGLDMLTRALVKETKDTAVRVGQVRPGMLITEGWLREAAVAPEQVASQRKILNILCDHVDDVAPYLVERMLASTRSGDEIAWLTNARMMRKFMSPKQDVLARYGL